MYRLSARQEDSVHCRGGEGSQLQLPKAKGKPQGGYHQVGAVTRLPMGSERVVVA